MDKIQPDWMKCPNCNTSSGLDFKSFSFLRCIGLGFFGEIAIWIIAGVVLIFFSFLDFMDAYGIAILALCVAALIFAPKYIPNFRCSLCNQSFTIAQLKKEYNQSLKNGTREKSRAP